MVDLTKSRSPPKDAAYETYRDTKRESRGATEKVTLVAKAKRSEPPVSTISSKGKPQVILPLRSKASALAIEPEAEVSEDVAETSPSPNKNDPMEDDNGDDLMDMYTNANEPEPEVTDGHNISEAHEDHDQAVDVAIITAPPSKRSAPGSSPVANGKVKRVRTNPAASAIDSPSTRHNETPKTGGRMKARSSGTPDSSTNRSEVKAGAVEGSTSASPRSLKNKLLAPVTLPTDSEFRALLSGINDSSQSSGSIGLAQTQLDPILQFSSPTRDSLTRSKVARAGPSNLAKGVRPRMVDGEEVLGVDSDSEGEVGSDSDPSQDIHMETEIVDEILAPVEVGVLETRQMGTKADGKMSPVEAEKSASIPAEAEIECSPLRPHNLAEDTSAAFRAVEELMIDPAATERCIADIDTPPDAPSSSIEAGRSILTRPAATEMSSSKSLRTIAEQKLKITALRQMVSELELEEIGGWQREGKSFVVTESGVTSVRGLARELAKQFAAAMDKAKGSVAMPPASTEAPVPWIEPIYQPVIQTFDMGLQTDFIPVVPAAATADVALQTDLILPPLTPVIVTDTTTHTSLPPVTRTIAGTDVAAQSDPASGPPALGQAAFEEQLAAKDADRKKWRIRAKRAEGEVATMQEDLQFIRDQYQEASASAVREVHKSTDLEEKMVILKGQLKHGLKQRDLHHAAVNGRQDKQVTILVAQNKILLEQSRRTDDEVRSRAAAYHEVEAQRERLEQLLRDAMRKIDSLSDRNDELVNQIEVLRAKQMGVLANIDDDSSDEDYRNSDDSEAESSAAPSHSPSLSPPPSLGPDHTTGESGSFSKPTTMAHTAPVESLTASQLMPDTQDLLSAESSLASQTKRQNTERTRAMPETEGSSRSGDAIQSPWTKNLFYPNESVS